MKPIRNFQFISLLLAAALILAACSGSAPETAAPEVEEDTGGTKTDAADPNLVASLADVKSAVIQIEAQGTFVDPEFGEYSGAGLGSGFIIDPSGLALTNNHVVTGAALLNVWVGGDTTKTYNAQILAVSECSDLALIDIEGDGFPYLEWYSDPITVGLEVYAAGFPLGDPEFTLTKGIVSKEKADGESSWASVNHVIEHDATINPGNSGGPLVTDDGQIVGVNYASYAAAGQFFAIGRDTTLQILEQFKNGDDVDSLGINGIAVMNNDGSLSGIWVSNVKSGSAADDAGVEPGDLITSLEGLGLAADGDMSTYCDIIRTQGDEGTLAMEVLRFDTNEVLEGQFNGRALSVTSSLDESAGDTSGGSTITSEGTGSDFIVEIFDDGFMAVTNETFELYMEVPASWNEVDGTSYTDDWGEYYFDAIDVTAAPNLEDYWDYYDSPGVSLTVSSDWAAIGDAETLLDWTTTWGNAECDYDGRDIYEDPVFEGLYDYWFCGDSDLIFIAAAPIEDPNAFLVLVTIQLTPQEGDDVLERILETFDYIP